MSNISITSQPVVLLEGDSGTTNFSFEVTREENTSNLEAVEFQVSGSGTNPASAEDFTASTPDLVTTTNSGTIPSTGQTLDISLTLSDGSTDTSVPVTGFVSRGDVPVPPINIALIVDVSFSTADDFVGNVSVGDLNGDGDADTILDAEIAAVEILETRIAETNLGETEVNLTLITFSEDATVRLVTTPGADSDGDGQTDLSEALRSLTPTENTNFEAPLQSAITFYNALPTGDNFVFFLSDGENNEGGSFDDEVQTLLDPSGIDASIRAIGIGSDANLEQLDLLDDGIDNDSAELSLDPQQLSVQLTQSPISPAEVDRVEFFLDGNLVQTIDETDLTDTTFGLEYNLTIPGLNPTQDNVIEARVIGNDVNATAVATSQTVEATQTLQILPNGVITFLPNETTQTVNIGVLGETLLEEDEDFTVTLTTDNPDITLTNPTAAGTILNDDFAPEAEDDEVTTDEDTAIVIPQEDLVSNDQDEDNDPLSIIAIDSSNTIGSVIFNGTQITYNPNGQFENLGAGETATDTFNYTVSDGNGGTDTGTVTVNITGRNDLRLIDDNLVIEGQGETPLNFTRLDSTTNLVHEVGVVALDENNQVNGIAPGENGFTTAALSASQVIFSSLSDRSDELIQGVNFNRTLLLEGSPSILFYLVENGTQDGVLNGSTNVFFSLPEANPENQNNVQITQPGDNVFQINWEENPGGVNSDFDDVIFQVQIGEESNVNHSQEEEIIDLTPFPNQLQVEFPVVRSEAAFDNVVGFYQIENIQGTVRDPITGQLLNPGDTGYAQAAVAVSQEATRGFTLDRNGEGLETTLEGRALYAPFIISNGTIEEALNGDGSDIYFSYLEANTDNTDHIRLLGNNSFGFEDLPEGGDLDYNDIVFQANFLPL